MNPNCAKPGSDDCPPIGNDNLPKTPSSGDPDPPALSLPSPKPSGRGGKCVMLVVHEEAIRLVAKWVLTDFGYQVEVARCGEEALALFDPSLHDLVVTAEIMPHISGAELAHIIKLRSPGTPVVLLADNGAHADRTLLGGVLERVPDIWALPGALERLLAPSLPEG